MEAKQVVFCLFVCLFVFKRVLNQKENTRLCKESLYHYFWDFCLDPTCLAPGLHCSPRYREPFSSLFTSALVRHDQTTDTWQKGFPAASEGQQCSQQGWGLDKLVFNREALSTPKWDKEL